MPTPRASYLCTPSPVSELEPLAAETVDACQTSYDVTSRESHSKTAPNVFTSRHETMEPYGQAGIYGNVTRDLGVTGPCQRSQRNEHQRTFKFNTISTTHASTANILEECHSNRIHFCHPAISRTKDADDATALPLEAYLSYVIYGIGGKSNTKLDQRAISHPMTEIFGKVVVGGKEGTGSRPVGGSVCSARRIDHEFMGDGRGPPHNSFHPPKSLGRNANPPYPRGAFHDKGSCPAVVVDLQFSDMRDSLNFRKAAGGPIESGLKKESEIFKLPKAFISTIE
ncbi:uncharacterized protein BT62DRAFT_1011396 [Guyanagaster necrorhizus]|uniref:Uncharacterized protein n=1 Tax=Guyanagaster necrorhizus TaxID=856835 RepID=A0A9P8ANC2_9AGAR|nr:uncharacterized protein BT62DRAFT_1011396 [Guyanagaster necrorhizus MCA 3950]KAG7441591.1 hypothetical protein BT62DRAFT_1011396 [Guyanagaster necrorhizus MCA 3950]